VNYFQTKNPYQSTNQCALSQIADPTGCIRHSAPKSLGQMFAQKFARLLSGGRGWPSWNETEA